MKKAAVCFCEVYELPACPCVSSALITAALVIWKGLFNPNKENRFKKFEYFSCEDTVFSDDDPYYPRIPVQTVSQTVAAQILRNISETSLPAAWLPSIRSFLAQAEDKSNSTGM